MAAAAASVSQIGEELDATGENVNYLGENFDKLSPKIKKVADDAKDAGQKIDYSFREARGGIMLVGEEIGVHLPRELAMLLAHIPAVGMAFSMMLPIIGVVAAIKVIGDLIEKHEQLAEAERHASEVSETLEIKQHDLALGLEAANLQLEDQIRKLEGRPAVNTLQLAMMAVKRSVDDLATTYATDFQKMDKLVEDQFGLWARLKRGAMDVIMVLDEMASSDEGDEGEASRRVKENAEEVASLRALIAAERELDQARRKLADEDPSKNMETWKAAAGAVAIAAGNVQKMADAAHEAVKKVQPDAFELLGTLTDKATTAKGEWQAMASEITHAGLEAKKANQELANVSAEKQIAEAKRALDAQLANIETWKAQQHAVYEEGKIDAAAWQLAEVQASDAAAIAHESYLQKVITLYQRSGQAIKAQETAQQLATLQTKDAAKATDELASAMNKHHEATHKIVEEYAHLIDANVGKDFEATAKAAEKLTAAEDELLKAQSKLAEDKLSQHYKDEETAITKLAAMHLITEEQKDDRLKLLEQQQANEALAILQRQLDQEKAVVDAAQAKLSQVKLAQVHTNPLFSDTQLADLKKNLDQALAAFSSADATLKAAQANVAMASGNPFYTDAQRADLKKKLDEATADFGQAQSRVDAVKAQADKAISGLFVTPAQVAEDKKNLDAATAAYAKAEADVQALHKTATSGQFFTEAEKAALLKRIDEAEAAFKAAQEALNAAQTKSSDNAFIPNAEVLEAEANAKKLAAAVSNTEAQIVSTKEKFNKQSEADDKSHYGRALLIAMAAGNELLAEQIKQNHAALLSAQGELATAKARGLNTAAIEKEIAALKQNESALEKESTGNKLATTDKQRFVQEALLAAQAVLAEAKARGLNTLAIEQEIKYLQQLEKLEQQAPVQMKQMETGMQGLRLATAQLKDEMKAMEQQMSQAFATAIMGAIESGKSIGAALEAATKQVLLQLATQALAKAIFYTAEGIAATVFDPEAAAAYFAAAAEFGLVAGVTGAVGMAIPGGSGGGSGNQAAAPSAGQLTTGAGAGGGSGSQQTVGVTHLAAGGVVSRKVMIGDSPSGGDADEAILPLSDQGAMRKIVNAILPVLPQNAPGFGWGTPSQRPPLGFDLSQPSSSDRPDIHSGNPNDGDFQRSEASLPRDMEGMQALAASFGGLLSTPTLRAASGARGATAAASAAAVPPAGFDSNSMEKFADRIGKQVNQGGQVQGDTTHVHVAVKGMISPDNLHKVIKRINRQVANRQTTLKASDSLRVTRRSQ